MRKQWYSCKRSGFKTLTLPFCKTYHLLEGLPSSIKGSWRVLIKISRTKASQLQPAHLLRLLFSALRANRGLSGRKSHSKMLQSSKLLTRSHWPCQHLKEFLATNCWRQLVETYKNKIVGLLASKEEKDSLSHLTRMRARWSCKTRIRACKSLTSAILGLPSLWSSTSCRSSMTNAWKVCELLRRCPAAHSLVGTNQSVL